MSIQSHSRRPQEGLRCSPTRGELGSDAATTTPQDPKPRRPDVAVYAYNDTTAVVAGRPYEYAGDHSADRVFANNAKSS
jgi:hypothetical protein